MRSTLRALLPALAALLALPALAVAQGGPRTLDVPASAAWKHAGTEIVLPPRVGGLVRVSIGDNTQNEQDVFATYVDRDERMIALVYVYRVGEGDVPLWFDRTLATILLTQTDAATPAIAGFTRPGASVASGLRAAMSDNVAGMRSTAVAIAPLGPSWLVKIRMGSAQLDPAALNERLSAFVAALQWPAESGPARIAVPIEPCATPLRLRNARLLRSSEGDLLAGALMGVDLTDEDGNAPPPPVYCREPGATPAYGVYRPNGSRDSYLIALNDSGIGYSVAQSIDLDALTGQGSSGRRFALTLRDRDATGIVASFSRLPPPEQALDVARRLGGPMILISQSPPAGD